MNIQSVSPNSNYACVSSCPFSLSYLSSYLFYLSCPPYLSSLIFFYPSLISHFPTSMTFFFSACPQSWTLITTFFVSSLFFSCLFYGSPLYCPPIIMIYTLTQFFILLFLFFSLQFNSTIDSIFLTLNKASYFQLCNQALRLSCCIYFPLCFCQSLLIFPSFIPVTAL
jgi:hypothetical protein